MSGPVHCQARSSRATPAVLNGRGRALGARWAWQPAGRPAKGERQVRWATLGQSGMVKPASIEQSIAKPLNIKNTHFKNTHSMILSGVNYLEQPWERGTGDGATDRGWGEVEGDERNAVTGPLMPWTNYSVSIKRHWSLWSLLRALIAGSAPHITHTHNKHTELFEHTYLSFNLRNTVWAMVYFYRTDSVHLWFHLEGCFR